MTLAVTFCIVAMAAVWAGLLREDWPRKVLTVAAAALGLYGIWSHGPPLVGDWAEASSWHFLILVGGVILWRDGVKSARMGYDRLGVTWERAAKLAAWGIFQQALMLGFLLPEFGPVGAVGFFVLMHMPNLKLSAVTLIGGVLSVLIYYNAPSLLIPGLNHAILSGLLSSLPDRYHGDMRIGPDFLDWKRSQ
jgi:hypothetical protein